VFDTTALTRAKKGSRQRPKTTPLSTGFQDVGTEKKDGLVVTGKVHALIKVSHLLTVTIEHLGSNTIGVEQ
jgi:hypothetical protein